MTTVLGLAELAASPSTRITYLRVDRGPISFPVTTDYLVYMRADLTGPSMNLSFYSRRPGCLMSPDDAFEEVDIGKVRA
jgi:hypothetical protein